MWPVGKTEGGGLLGSTHLQGIIGASLSEPHIGELSIARVCVLVPRACGVVLRARCGNIYGTGEVLRFNFVRRFTITTMTDRQDERGRAAEQPKTWQAMLERKHECTRDWRAAEQSEARQARLERRRDLRAAEQPEARQARLERQQTVQG